MKNLSLRFSFKILALAALLACATTQAADFTTTAGYNQTCQEMQKVKNPARLQNDNARVAFVICNDTKLSQQIITWATREFKDIEKTENAKNRGQELIDHVLKEVDYTRNQLALSQGVLEKIHLGKKKSLRLVPAQWSMDLNGDGKTEIWEKYFFAIPKRGTNPSEPMMPNNTQQHYDDEYQLDAAIKVDQSDILWSLSYHYFIAGLLANIRAFDIDDEPFEIRLSRPELLKTAHQLIGKGIDTSEKMRQSVLAETSNDEEWIGNPKQTASVFPIELDAQDFVTWGLILNEWSALWQGEHLLPVAQGGLLEEFGGCPDGSGLNIKKLYLEPPKKQAILPIRHNPDFLSTQCQPIDADHPVSTLPDMITHAKDSDPSMHFLRYLYWAN